MVIWSCNNFFYIFPCLYISIMHDLLRRQRFNYVVLTSTYATDIFLYTVLKYCCCFCIQVKLIKCVIDNIVVDISFNQIGGVTTLCLLELVIHGNLNYLLHLEVFILNTAQ